ncbi:tRNA threonylcarbamoyladenosine dehydratase, partial [Pseudomonas syringae]|nr:tRNA threonylcarbamoyladenosine dehydratase [Pseudomonas syringae]
PTGGGGGQFDRTLIQTAHRTPPFNAPWPPRGRSPLRVDCVFPPPPNRHYSVPCVFSTEQLRYPKPDGSICLEKKFVGDGVKLDCAGGFGAVMMVTATFGMVAATRAVDKLVAGTRRPSERIKPLAVAADQA